MSFSWKVDADRYSRSQPPARGDGTTMRHNGSWPLLEERFRARRHRGRGGVEWTEARRIVLRERAGREVAPSAEVPTVAAPPPP
jgi:hypothetical protein